MSWKGICDSSMLVVREHLPSGKLVQVGGQANMIFLCLLTKRLSETKFILGK